MLDMIVEQKPIGLHPAMCAKRIELDPEDEAGSMAMAMAIEPEHKRNGVRQAVARDRHEPASRGELPCSAWR